MSKGAMHRMAGILAVELDVGPLGIRAFNLDPAFVVTERMALLQGEHGLQSYRGAPPSVPGAVVAWLAAEANDLNCQTVIAQKVALKLGLHPDWRTSEKASRD